MGPCIGKVESWDFLSLLKKLASGIHIHVVYTNRYKKNQDDNTSSDIYDVSFINSVLGTLLCRSVKF